MLLIYVNEKQTHRENVIASLILGRLMIDSLNMDSCGEKKIMQCLASVFVKTCHITIQG